MTFDEAYEQWRTEALEDAQAQGIIPEFYTVEELTKDITDEAEWWEISEDGRIYHSGMWVGSPNQVLRWDTWCRQNGHDASWSYWRKRR